MNGGAAHPFIPVAALLICLVGASMFGSTARLAERTRPLVAKTVCALAWGTELPNHVGARFTVHSVRAFGPGLHIYLRPSEGAAPIHLKVAQPQKAESDESSLVISDAKYVQWAGRKVRKVAGAKALELRTIRQPGPD
jgi:hypothetical protein